MMAFTIISAVFFLSSLGLLIRILLPKISTLSSIDIESIPHERNVLAKDRILYDRMRRRIKEWESFLIFVLHPLADFFRQFFNALIHAYKRLSDAREFQKRQWFKAHTVEPTEQTESEQYQRVLKEANELLAAERYGDAELKCIDLISRNKDGLAPYGMLVSLYTAQKEWEKARDVADYLVKIYRHNLKNADEEKKSSMECEAATNAAQLADIYIQLGALDQAFQSIRRALTLQPANPKYLDACIEIAILAQQRLKAEKYLDQLRAANPENNKIDDFDERIKKLSY